MDLFSARIAAVEALRSAAGPRAKSPVALHDAADALDAAAPDYEHSATAVAYTALADLLRTCARLVEWRAALLEAGLDSDRFIRAAKERHEIWCAEFGTKPGAIALAGASIAIRSAASIQDVGRILENISGVSLPIGVFRQESRMRVPAEFMSQTPSDPKPRENDRPPELAVAFIMFSINDVPAAGTHFLRPGEHHDLKIEVRVSRWPERAELLELRPLSVDPSDTYEFPIFRLGKPTGPAPFVMTDVGRALVKFPQSLQARPSEFRYTARFVPEDAEQPMTVVGQRTLRIESIDIRTIGWTGFPNLDEKLLRIRDLLRTDTTVPSEDLRDALVVLRVLASFAGACAIGNEVKEPWSEKRFQAAMGHDLRRTPDIGAELVEHPQVSGGIADFAYRGIFLELKATSDRPLELNDCRRYAPQAAAYAAGAGKRIALLAVLDSSAKSEGAFPPEDGLGVFLESATGLPVAVVTVLIQGNLLRPSELSR